MGSFHLHHFMEEQEIFENQSRPKFTMVSNNALKERLRRPSRAYLLHDWFSTYQTGATPPVQKEFSTLLAEKSPPKAAPHGQHLLRR